MKKVIVSVFTVSALFLANAQDDNKPNFGFSEGDVIIEGNIGFNSTNNKNTKEKTNELVFAPRFGYFLSDDFALGVGLGIATSKEEAGNVTLNKTSIFSVGVFGRYYFLNISDRFKTFANVTLEYASGTEEEPMQPKLEVTGFGFGAGLGVNYFVTENLALVFSLSDVLSYTSLKPKDGENVSEFQANINVFDNFFTTARFGLTYKF